MSKKDIIAASTIPVILSILQEREHYGYELIKKVYDLSAGSLEWSEAMLYPVLHRLQRDGYLNSRWITLDNGRRRKYYKITDLGKELLHSKKEDWISILSLFAKLWDLKIDIR